MGLFTTLFCYVLPGVGAATYLSFSLGSRLPEACRKMGDNEQELVIMSLKTNLPTDLIKSNELIKLMRQTEQQANALNRELKTSLHKIKQDLREQIPEELKKNPHQMLQLKDYRKSEIQETTSLYGSEVIAKSLQERARLKREKQQRGQLNNFSKSL